MSAGNRIPVPENTPYRQSTDGLWDGGAIPVDVFITVAFGRFGHAVSADVWDWNGSYY